MVCPGADRPVAMDIAILARKETGQRVLEIGLRSRPDLHESDARCGMGSEDVDQPVTMVPAEPSDVISKVDDRPAGSVDREQEGVHFPMFAPGVTARSRSVGRESGDNRGFTLR